MTSAKSQFDELSAYCVCLQIKEEAKYNEWLRRQALVEEEEEERRQAARKLQVSIYSLAATANIRLACKVLLRMSIVFTFQFVRIY